MPISRQFSPIGELLVGTETGDDAAVWQLDDRTCIIATTDFFMPMVDDPFDFGRIAATNAISDVYAMGGRPIMALAILGVPVDKVSPATVREILKGGSQVCVAAGIPIAGGHSMNSPEPIYGLAVIGIGRPQDVRRNNGAKAGDALILTKALGVGIYSRPSKKGTLVVRSLHRDGGVDDAAQPDRHGTGQRSGRARRDRCNRLWSIRTCLGDGAGARIAPSSYVSTTCPYSPQLQTSRNSILLLALRHGTG